MKVVILRHKKAKAKAKSEESVSEYAPSATPKSEDYSSCESSSLETPSESSESLAWSDSDSRG